MKSSELREKYLSFFEEKGCKRWPSSSLIPDDPSMLLTSAGMVQFKPYFLQLKQLEAPYVGTVSVQKCVRTTDIDIIGTTGRHLSFFEMLGNFSFGAYFKKEMCAWAYEFSTEVLGFDPERLYFSVYLDDDEAVEIWKSIGVPENRIVRLGAEDNFWAAGPTGPCGPCSELYYDYGPEYGCDNPECAPGCDCDRFVEYWNLVFTQFDRQEDGTLVPLPKKNIDTGMGLERTAAILQHVGSNYETDILRGLIAVGEKLSAKSYGTDGQDDLSLRICADHARSVSFMIADGILPSNEGRGFVLRRLLRRAVRHGLRLGIEAPFLSHYVVAVIGEMAASYPELRDNKSLIERVVNAEEERFNQTLRSGQNYLDVHLAELSANNPVLSGKAAFELHDTYGFPIDLTVEIAAEQGYGVDRAGFEVYMEDQRTRARAAANDDAWGTIGSVFGEIHNEYGDTDFVGYSETETDARIIALVVQESDEEASGEATGEKPTAKQYCLVDSITPGQKAQVVLDKTPFYGEKGGQVGDIGYLETADVTFNVDDTKIHEGSITAHVGSSDGVLSVGDTIHASIDTLYRERIERNHTATHLLHEALRGVLGDHVKQAGSLVAAERLRFDFTHFEAVSAEQLRSVEDIVNAAIMSDTEVRTFETSLDEARQAGVTALFGEKYGDVVRVIEANDDSKELCGGTHVRHTAQIGFVKITGESSVGANVRRIEAITSLDALNYVNRLESELQNIAALVKTPVFEVRPKIEAIQNHVRELEAALKQGKAAGTADVVDSLAAEAIDVGYFLVVARLDGHDVEGLRTVTDKMRERLATNGKGAAVVFGARTPADTPLLLAAGTKDAVECGFDASAVIKHIAFAIKGGGGGKAQMAQAGGKDVQGLDRALEMARELLIGNDSPE